MKKWLIVLFSLLAVLLIVFAMHGNFRNEIPTPTASPIESSVPEPVETEDMAEPEETPAPTVTPDPRNEEPVVRAEIANLIRDAKELLQEGLTDDAAMLIRDLRTRELTEAERKQVDALQASLKN